MNLGSGALARLVPPVRPWHCHCSCCTFSFFLFFFSRTHTHNSVPLHLWGPFPLTTFISSTLILRLILSLNFEDYSKSLFILFEGTGPTGQKGDETTDSEIIPALAERTGCVWFIATLGQSRNYCIHRVTRCDLWMLWKGRRSHWARNRAVWKSYWWDDGDNKLFPKEKRRRE